MRDIPPGFIFCCRCRNTIPYWLHEHECYLQCRVKHSPLLEGHVIHYILCFKIRDPQSILGTERTALPGFIATEILSIEEMPIESDFVQVQVKYEKRK